VLQICQSVFETAQQFAEEYGPRVALVVLIIAAAGFVWGLISRVLLRHSS
jgi:hypothetical protein